MKDNMFAALIGHPGGYYSTVSGGELGDTYTAEVLVSPPNINRVNVFDLIFGFGQYVLYRLEMRSLSGIFKGQTPIFTSGWILIMPILGGASLPASSLLLI